MESRVAMSTDLSVAQLMATESSTSSKFPERMQHCQHMARPRFPEWRSIRIDTAHQLVNQHRDILNRTRHLEFSGC